MQAAGHDAEPLSLRLAQDANVTEIAIILGKIQTVAHYELVRDLEAHVRDFHRPQTAIGLIEQRRDMQPRAPRKCIAVTVLL